MFVISSEGKIQKIQPKTSMENYHPTSYKQVMKASTQPTDPSAKGGNWIVIIIMALIIIGIIYAIIWALRKYSKKQQPAFGYSF